MHKKTTRTGKQRSRQRDRRTKVVEMEIETLSCEEDEKVVRVAEAHSPQ
jgi:hypothetical protein